MTGGTMTPADGQYPRQAVSLMALRSSAWLTASRTRRSCQGDLGSHFSANSIYLADAQIQFLGAGAFVTFEAELHVVSRDGVTVVKLQPVAQLELVPEAVWALRPRLRQTVAHLLPRQRTDERIVQRIEHSEGRDLWWGRRGIKPGRGNGDGPGHHGLGPGPRLAGNVLIHSEREQGYSQDRHEATCGYARHRPTPTHGSLLHVH